jgi:RNA polymerase-binding transcription factor DksA
MVFNMTSVSSTRSRAPTKKKAPPVARQGKTKPLPVVKEKVKVKAPVKVTKVTKVVAPAKHIKSVAKSTKKAPPVSAKLVKVVQGASIPISHTRSFSMALNESLDTVGLVGMDMGPLPNDEVFDEADGAQHLQLREIAETQRRARLLNQPERHPDFDGKHCLDCESLIPQVRLNLQRIRCVECQQELENTLKRLEVSRR